MDAPVEPITDTRKETSLLIDRLKDWTQHVDQKEAAWFATRAEKKENFNLLNCLDRYHLEALHSNIIHYLLNEKADHDCGNLFLKLFIEVLKEDKQFKDDQFLDRFSQEIAGTTAIKEMSIGGEGRIDIFLESTGCLMVIENKIFAREQHDQLIRYNRYCQNRCANEKKQFLILYLTLNGRRSQQAGGTLYYAVSYSSHILTWLKKCITAIEKYPSVAAGLRSYIGLLENKILHITSSGLIMEIKDILLQPENHVIVKHLRELHDVLIPLRNQLRVDFFCRIKDLLEKEGFQFNIYAYEDNAEVSISMDKIYDTRYRGLRLQNPEYTIQLDDQVCFYFLIEHDWDELYYGLVPFDKNRPLHSYIPDERISNFFNEFSQELGDELKGHDNCWHAWKLVDRFRSSQFSDDKLNYELLSNINTIANEFATEVRNYLCALKKRLDKSF